MDSYGEYPTWLGAGMVMMMFAIFIVTYAINAFGLMKLYEKVPGVPKVAAWVPFWNSWVLFEIGGLKGWYSLLTLAGFIPVIGWIGSIAGIVLMVIAAHNIAKGFRKESPAIWTVLFFFLPIVWYYILGFDKSTWQGVAGTNPTLFQEPKYSPVPEQTYNGFAQPMQQPGYPQGGYPPAQPQQPGLPPHNFGGQPPQNNNLPPFGNENGNPTNPYQ